MRRHLFLLTGVAGALVLAACGAAVPPAGVHLRSGSATTVTTGAPATSAPPSGATGGSATTTAGHGTSGTGGSGNGSGPGVSPGATPGSTGPAPAAAGTYHYAQSGSFTAAGSTQAIPPQGTIVVDAPTANGPGSYGQVWHSYVNPSQPPSDTTFAITPAGISVVSEVIRMTYGGQTQSFTCTFASPMTIVQWPPKVGYHFTGSANCGSFTVSASGSITGTQTASVGGSSVSTYVVTTNITTSGQVASTGTETDWFDPALGLDVHQATNQKGSFGPFSFQSQATRDLTSTRPS
ncbi:MAG TPA: hypothetical protein VE991_03520 [Acidimicrobiales bacterium]|nr:hypothetical protein [Acidimicrobiales bacterium]